MSDKTPKYFDGTVNIKSRAKGTDKVTIDCERRNIEYVGHADPT